MTTTLRLRGKAILLLVPVVVLISVVHTLVAIRTERAILRTEILRRGETMAAIAAKSAELAILSRSPDLLERAVRPLRNLRDVSFAGLYDTRFNPLLPRAGHALPKLPPDLSPATPLTVVETPGFFEFIVPVFTVKEGAEIDIFQEQVSAGPASEHIGWARISISQEARRRAEAAFVHRGTLLGVLFSGVGVGMVYVLIAFLTRPLHALTEAVKGLQEGRYAEIPTIPSGDEVGRLSQEFSRMSVAIREREARILESQERLRSLFERVEHGIFRLDAEGNVVERNRKFEELFPAATTFADLFPRGVEDRLSRADRGALRHVEERVVGRDGAELTVMMSLYADHDASGLPAGFDGYLVDITERKVLEDALIQTQKLECVGLLAGGVAHDFNNILSGILGYAELIQRGDRPRETVVQYAGVIEKSALRASALTQQLLGFARKGKSRIEAVWVNTVVEELVHVLRETFDRTITVVLHSEPDVPPVLGDSTQVYQALLNLCINSRDAMPAGGLLSIKTELCARATEKAYERFQVPPGDYAQISVTDTGTGMAPEVKKRVFEPFYTTKEVGKGTGLGLAMVYGIVKNHGGYITVYSEVGLGTTMRIYLPVARGAAAVGVPEESYVAELRSATILFVEDEDVVRELTREILESHSYRVLLARNGREGVEMFQEHGDAVDLVLLDMVMPEKSGTEAFKEIRAMRPDVRVLLCSGFDQEEYFRELFELGAVGFVPKPFRFSELLRQVEKALGGAESRPIP